MNNLGVFKYISKPWNDDGEFLPAIREAIEYYNLKTENAKMKKQLEVTTTKRIRNKNEQINTI